MDTTQCVVAKSLCAQAPRVVDGVHPVTAAAVDDRHTSIGDAVRSVLPPPGAASTRCGLLVRRIQFIRVAGGLH